MQFFFFLKRWFHLLRWKKRNPNLPGPLCNSNCSLNLIAGCITLGSKNCKKAFVITSNESFTMVRRKFAPLFFAELLQVTRRSYVALSFCWPLVVFCYCAIENTIFDNKGVVHMPQEHPRLQAMIFVHVLDTGVKKRAELSTDHQLRLS